MPGMSQRQKDGTQLGQKWGHSTVLLQGLSTRNLRFKGAAAGSREPSSILLCFGGWAAASSVDVAKGGATNAPMAHVDLYSVRYRMWKRMETKVGGATAAAKKDLAAHLPRGYHTATALVDSRYMLVFGGLGSDGRPTARTVVLDTSSWTWHAPELSPLSMTPPEPRWRHAAAHYPDEPEDSEGGDVDAVWDASATAIIVGGYEGGAALTGTAYSLRLETSDHGSSSTGRGRGKAAASVAPVTLRWAELDRTGAQAACRADGVLVPLPELKGWVFACGADEVGPSNALTLLQVGPRGEEPPSPPSGAAAAAAVEAAAAAAAAAPVTPRPRTRTKSPATRRGGAKGSSGSGLATPPSPSPPARKAAGRKATSAARKTTPKARGGPKEPAAAADTEAAGLAAAAAAAAAVATVDPPAANDDASGSRSSTKIDSPSPTAAGRTPATRRKAGTPAKNVAAASKMTVASAKRASSTSGGGGVRKRRRLAEPPPGLPAAALDGDDDRDEDDATDDGDGDEEEPPYEPPAAAPPPRAATARRLAKSSTKAAARSGATAAPTAAEEFGGAGGGPTRPPPPAPRADTRTKAQLLVALDTALSQVAVEQTVTSATKTTVDGLRAAAASHAKAMAALKDENARLRAAATLAENRASSARTGALLGPSVGGSARMAAAATAAASAAAAAAAVAMATMTLPSAVLSTLRLPLRWPTFKSFSKSPGSTPRMAARLVLVTPRPTPAAAAGDCCRLHAWAWLRSRGGRPAGTPGRG
eukprot:TRINITY_DN9147_c0_g1_i1.p1 TRINITY_DN9147_c0_g1~~TRINITY_DN9147_c0_g1_i1.p1  ORF type:complete len:893 (+),score=190.72 TRINITY_DN9147_c0_g1_i1:401-2680(+)